MIKSIATYQSIVRSSCLAVLFIPNLANAEALPKPMHDVLLTVSGAISETNEGDTAVFDLEMLQALEHSSFRTTTIWTDGLQHFEGTSLKTLLERLGVTKGTIQATAINEYFIEIPVSEVVANGPIIAYKLNGALMSVRDKGPLWIVYPYDQKSEYRTEVTYTRSIWQLDRLEIVK